MKKRGFTLVELLAVIAILAILVIMALPAVLRMFNQARIDTFSNEVNTILRTAKQQYLLEGGNAQTWTNADGSTNKLPLTGNSKLKYYVKMNGNGQITKLQVTNGEYQYSKSGIVEDVVKNDIKIVSELSEKDKLVLDGTGGERYVYYVGESDLYIGSQLLENITTYDTYQEAISAFGYPFFTRLTVTDQVWCINGSDGWNSCYDNHPMFFSTESECNDKLPPAPDDGITYTCNPQLADNETIIESYIGFIKDGNVYYLKGNDRASYAENKQVLINAFGSSNCTGDIAKSNVPKDLFSFILGIRDINAAAPLSLVCSTTEIESKVNSMGYISIKNISNSNFCEIAFGTNSYIYCGPERK